MRLFLLIFLFSVTACTKEAPKPSAGTANCICMKKAWSNDTGARPIKEAKGLHFIESKAAITCKSAAGHEYSISSKHPTKVMCSDNNGKKDVIKNNRISQFRRKEDHNRYWDVDPNKEIAACKEFLASTYGCKAP